MTTLTIIRGLPGSGKSTIAEKLVRDTVGGGYRVHHYEADKFFTNYLTGEYKFNPKLISQAHTWCFVNTIKSLNEGCDVIVSNTFTQLWEMERYIKIAEFVPGVEVCVIEVKTQFENIHGVPTDKLEQMRRRWEEIPFELGIQVEVIGG